MDPKPGVCIGLTHCQNAESSENASTVFDWVVPLKVFSFRDNTDYPGTRRVNETPFQKGESLPQSVVFQPNDNNEHNRQEFHGGH